jgi:hypothetical protein
MYDLSIVVFCNKLDFYLTRICIASIRYFYPDITLLLVKDELNGSFSTSELEKKFNVSLFDCGKKKFGWAASKTIFLLRAEAEKKYLLLDSDIIFTTPFIERVYQQYYDADIIVSGEWFDVVDPVHISNTYFNLDLIKEFDQNYKFPGFFFNTGQIFITGGVIDYGDTSAFFDADNYPYWKRLDIFPLVDQSLYNYLFPKLHEEKKIRLFADDFMIWSESEKAKKIKKADLIFKKADAGMIHWAGATRTPFLKKMTGTELLVFFQDLYYSKIFLGSFLMNYRKVSYVLFTFFLRAKKKIIKIVYER